MLMGMQMGPVMVPRIPRWWWMLMGMQMGQVLVPRIPRWWWMLMGQADDAEVLHLQIWEISVVLAKGEGGGDRKKRFYSEATPIPRISASLFFCLPPGPLIYVTPCLPAHICCSRVRAQETPLPRLEYPRGYTATVPEKLAVRAHSVTPDVHAAHAPRLRRALLLISESTVLRPPRDNIFESARGEVIGPGSGGQPSARCVRCACEVRAQCLRGACAVPARCVRCACEVRALCLRGACAVPARCVRCACEVRALCLRGACAVPARCVRCACEVRAQCRYVGDTRRDSGQGRRVDSSSRARETECLKGSSGQGMATRLIPGASRPVDSYPWHSPPGRGGGRHWPCEFRGTEEIFSSDHNGVAVERSGFGPRAWSPPPGAGHHVVSVPPGVGGWGHGRTFCGGCLEGGGAVTAPNLDQPNRTLGIHTRVVGAPPVLICTACVSQSAL